MCGLAERRMRRSEDKPHAACLRTRTCAGPPGGTCAARNMTELCSDARELMRTPTSKPPAAAGSSTPLRPVAERITGASTLGRMVLCAQERGEDVALRYPTPAGVQTVTYGELGERSRELALGLIALGIEGGRRRVDPVLYERAVDAVRAGRGLRGRGGGTDLSHQLAGGVQARAGGLPSAGRVLSRTRSRWRRSRGSARSCPSSSTSS